MTNICMLSTRTYTHSYLQRVYNTLPDEDIEFDKAEMEQAHPHQVKSCYTKLLRLKRLARTQDFGTQLMLK